MAGDAPVPSAPKPKKVTVRTLQRMKNKGVRITMLTAYDATFARLLDGAGVDMLLVGDSLGMVIQGLENTLPVTVDDILYHTRAVRRGAPHPLLVADMPYRSYQVSLEEAVRNATRLIAEGGAEAVKLEGGAAFCDVVRALVRASVPVMGHLGLTPQSVHQLGGYRIQGKTASAAQRLVDDALALEEAGCFSIVLEGIPTDVATRISEALRIPTIGIGAGAGCDGQVLVIYDLLGLDPEFQPKFVKRYAELGGVIQDAVRTFCQEVRDGAFPDEEHSFTGTAKEPKLKAVYGGNGSR